MLRQHGKYGSKLMCYCCLYYEIATFLFSGTECELTNEKWESLIRLSDCEIQVSSVMWTNERIRVEKEVRNSNTTKGTEPSCAPSNALLRELTWLEINLSLLSGFISSRKFKVEQPGTRYWQACLQEISFFHNSVITPHCWKKYVW